MSIRLRSPNSAKTDSLNKSVDSATSFTSELSAEAKKKKVLTVYKPRGESPAVVQSKQALQTPEHDEDSPSIFEKLRGHLLKALFFVLNGILLVCILILQGIGFVFAIVFKMILIASAKVINNRFALTCSLNSLSSSRTAQCGQGKNARLIAPTRIFDSLS